jgi:hypothetical protein
MRDNVVPHPASSFLEATNSKEKIDCERFIDLLISAFEGDLPRDPLDKMLTKGRVDWNGGVKAIRRFAEWCDEVSFSLPAEPQSCEPENETETSPDEEEFEADPFMSEIMKGAVESLVAAQDAHDTFMSLGSKHKYWFFRPGWEVDSALWAQTFGDDDPASIIAFYLSNMFRTERGRSPWTRKTKSIELSEADRALVRRVFAKAPGPNNDLLGRCLITACNLHEYIGGGIEWTDPDFCAAMGRVPSWIAGRLLTYWAFLDFEEITSQDQYDADLLRSQAEFITATLLSHMEQPRDDDFLLDPPEIEFISDSAISYILYKFNDYYFGDLYVTDLHDEIVKAIFRARSTVFAGVLPFQFEDGRDYLRMVRSENSFWPAHVLDLGDDANDFVVWSNETISAGGQDDSRRMNVRAARRFKAYRSVFKSIQEEGLDELAKAWWAFFIASQVIAFGRLSLPAPSLAETVQIASSLLPDRSVERALQLARDAIRNLSDPWEARISSALLERPLKDSSESNSRSNVFLLTASNLQVEEFLSKVIGRDVWQRLGDQTRRDLVEAEQLWTRSAIELGAGRSDWGSLVALYARAVEAETREHLLPIIEAAEAVGACKLSEPTLGGCMRAIRDIRKSLRSTQVHGLSENTKEMIERLHVFFAEKNKFWEDYRNRASHGNRDKPISAEELVRWRDAMFNGQLFLVLNSSAG